MTLYTKPVRIMYSRRASALIFVLIVVSSMTIIAVSLAYRARVGIKLAHASSQRVMAYYLALAGIQQCKSVLGQQELTPERTAKVCGFSSDNGKKFFEQLTVKLDEDAQLVCWIKDEAGFLDLNKSDSASWENLPEFDKGKRACILDWIDSDSDTNSDGAETDFYERLNPPYACKNAALVSLKELLFIKDINHGRYISGFSDSKLSQGLSDPDNVQFFSDSGVGEAPALVNLFTVHGQDKLNINTTSGNILSTLPGLNQQIADTILIFRAGPDGQPQTDDDICIENTEMISHIEGLTVMEIELLQQYSCFNSDAFRVFSYAKVRSYSCLFMATIKAGENTLDIVSIERLF